MSAASSSQDTALLRAAIVDSNGQLVPTATNNVTFTVISGPGRVWAAGEAEGKAKEP